MCGIKKKTFKEPKYHEGSFLGLFYFCILKRSSRTVLSSVLFTGLQRTPSYKFGSVRSSTQYLGTFTFEYVHCKCNGEVQYYMNEPQGFNYCKGQSLCIEINRLNTKQFWVGIRVRVRLRVGLRVVLRVTKTTKKNYRLYTRLIHLWKGKGGKGWDRARRQTLRPLFRPLVIILPIICQ